jgi:hypothetical protein
MFGGRRESRVSNAPAALRVKIENTQVSHHRFTGRFRPSPRNGFNGFLRALLGDRLFCHHRSTGHSAKLDASIGASGPHDFTVRFYRSSSESVKASTASRPTFVTMANVPLSGETGWILPVICRNDQSHDLRRINTTGKSVQIEEFVSTEQQLLGFRRLGR